jgi:glycosyltransferase involved in cell wall biosynthesis
VTRLPRLVVVGPLPPPVHGVAVSTSLVLANRVLRQRFDVEHLDTSDHRTGSNLGRWDATNVGLGLKHVLVLLRRLAGRRGTLYLPLSQSRAALVRDTLFIVLASSCRWRVAAHLRGSELGDLCARAGTMFRAWLRFSLGRLDAFAVMGESLRGVADGLVPNERIAVVPNGTPDDALPPKRDGKEVLFLSNLRRRKGVAEAVDVAVKVLEREPTARFRFVGSWEDSALERELRARAGRANGSIEFMGAATSDRRHELLRDASLLLFPPTEPEGHPRVVLEALCAGLPIVTTHRGAIAETVIDGECGFVLPDPDPAQLADRVLRLLRDDELRLRMSHAARARYQEHFTQEHADQVLAAWIERVAEG